MIAALLTPPMALFAVKAVESNKNEVSDWLPASYEETTQLRWFRKHFVADQFVLISWEGCDLGAAPDGSQDDPRMEKLVAALERAKVPSPTGGGEVPCFCKLTTGRRVLSELTAAPTNLPIEVALSRLQGTLIGPDGKQTCVLATLSNDAVKKMRAAVGRPIRRPLKLRNDVVSPLFVALAEAGIGEEEVRLGGPPIDNVAIDEEGERTLARLAGLAGLFGVGLAWWSLRSVRMTCIVFLCGGLSAGLALAIVPLTGGTMDAILMSMPALVYVLSVSGCIHFINYYVQAAEEHGVEAAVPYAVRHAWWPALLCSVTTAIGLVSLCPSDITPIRKFGAYSAAGVMAMLLVLFLVLPAILRFWPWRPHRPTAEQSERSAIPAPYWTRFGNAIRRRHGLVMTGCFGVIALLCFGLPRVTTSIDLLKLFGAEAKLITDYKWYEANIGRLVPMELVVRFPKESLREHLAPGAPTEALVASHNFLERFELVGRLQNSIESKLGPAGEDLAGATMSAVTFAQELTGPGAGFRRATERYIADQELAAHRDAFERSGFLRTDPETGEELWRISVRFAAFHGVDHGQLVSRLRSAVEPEFAARRAAVAALQGLSAELGAAPSGKRIALLTPQTGVEQAQCVAQHLAAKRVLAAGVPQSLSELTDKQRAALQKLDGVVVARETSEAELAELGRMGLTVLASIDPAGQSRSDGSEVGVAYTGVIPIVYKAQRSLLDSLISSTWWSFATITPLMMFVCGGVAAGAVVMLPNALPVLVVFGGMGWLGVPVDIGSMMAASIALGVAVDDTIHFLAWFREDMERLGDRAAATLCAYQRSATPTLQAALINGLGLSVFASSSFTPTQRFGWLMLAILMAGVAAELVMLPALLFGPLGAAFRPAKAADQQAKEVPAPHVRRRRPAQTTPTA